METVTRVRISPGGRDDNDDPVASVESESPLAAMAVAPGATSENADRGRDGETVEFTVYFIGAVDLTDDDDLIVRGQRCHVRVRDWRSAYGTGRRGLEVLASRKVG